MSRIYFFIFGTRFLEKFHYPFCSFYDRLKASIGYFYIFDSMWTALGDTEIRNCERDFSPSTVPFVLPCILFIEPYNKLLPDHSSNPFSSLYCFKIKVFRSKSIIPSSFSWESSLVMAERLVHKNCAISVRLSPSSMYLDFCFCACKER